MARAQAQPTHSLYEVLSIVLLGTGTLLFLALISYSPTDVPGWFPLSSAAAARGPVLNFIGSIGAIVACCAYSFLGAASFLLPALLLGYGSFALLNPGLRLTKRALWSIAFVISGACLAQTLPWPLLDMTRLNIAGQGGWVGQCIGQMLFGKLFGPVGAPILFVLLYATSLILLTGIHPISALHQLIALPARWRERREAGNVKI